MGTSVSEQDAMVKTFSEATARQAEALRQAVTGATLRAVQGREVMLACARTLLAPVTKAVVEDAARKPAVDVDALMNGAIARVDAATLQTVQANRRALQQLVDQRAELREQQLTSALAHVQKMEDDFFATVGKAARSIGGPLQAPWEQVFKAIALNGADAGAPAISAVERIVVQAQTALRDGRVAGLHAAQAVTDSATAMVSGVLAGLSEGLQPEPRAMPANGRRRKT